MRTIDTVNSTILLAIELSASSWLVAAGGRDQQATSASNRWRRDVTGSACTVC